MRDTTPATRTMASLVGAAIAAFLATSVARADVETMTPQTPTIIGGQVIGAGHLALGASVGYPGLRGRVVFGLGGRFDLEIEPQLTYANGWLSGLNQGLGVNVDVPMRITIATMARAVLALRLVPYVRVGRGYPSWGTGGTIGVRASIPLPKLFSIVVGVESRGGMGNFHVDGCNAGSGIDCNDTFFEGATYGVIGLETFFRQRWYFFGEYDIGAAYTSNGGYYYGGRDICFDAGGNPYACGSNAHAYFQAQFGFGYQMH